MQRTCCCSHHICEDCAREMLERIPAFRADYDPSKMEGGMCCPYCGQGGLSLAEVTRDTNIRTYDSSRPRNFPT
eukprot:765448-Hanusia_phi.AAC.2